LPADQEAVGESLVNSPLSVIQEGTVGPNFEATIDGGTAIDFNNGDMTLGITGVLGYKQDWTTEESIRQLADTQKLGIDATQTETSLDVTVNGLLSSALEWDDHLIQLTGLYIHSTTKEAQITEGDSFNLGQFITEQNIFLERALMMGQAAGEHALGDQFEINWRGAFARSTRDAPYERSFEDRIPDAAGVPTILPFTTLHSVNFSELTDDTWSGGVDLSWFAPIMGGREATVTIGYEYLDNDRDFISNPFQFITNTALPADVAQARVDFAYSPANIDPARFRLVDAGDDGVTSYDAELLVHGAFAQVDAELLPTLRATVGVRYEDAEESVDTFDRFGNDPAKDAFDSMLANDYWLPSAMVTWNFTDNMQFRLGYSHTIARPQFRELAASRFLDPETDRVYLGNPNLVDSEFRNYDARYEFYFGRNQFITLGGFYKEIKNPIEEIQSPLGDFNFQTSFINSPAAELLGGEFEYRTRFSIPWLDWTERRDWLFSVNYTYTNSEVKAGPGDLIIERDGTLTPGDTFGIDGSPMVGTPEHIVNAQFGWEGEHEQFTLLLGWVDERILARGERGNLANRLLDVIEEPGIQLDAVFRQFVEIAGTDVTIALTGRNLLGTKHKEQQRGTLAPEATNGITDFNTYERGRSISASVTAKF
jgi:outer membrane receptor protein involved in Fe transport